jgi:hypothetical protein
MHDPSPREIRHCGCGWCDTFGDAETFHLGVS